MRVLEATILAIGLVLAAGVYVVASAYFSPPRDSAADIEGLRAIVSRQSARITVLERDLRGFQSQLDQARAAPAQPVQEQFVLSQEGHEEIFVTQAPTEAIRVAKARFNQGLSQASSRFMIERLGHPRDSYSQTCGSVTDPKLRAALVTKKFGNFRVTLLKPALASFETVMKRIEAEAPDLYEKLGTAGGLCPRLIRGSTRAVSNHSWGSAVDLKIDNVLDPFADGETHAGLVLIATIFNEEGWYWGGGYRREDSMHFEVSRELVEAWLAEGAL